MESHTIHVCFRILHEWNSNVHISCNRLSYLSAENCSYLFEQKNLVVLFLALNNNKCDNLGGQDTTWFQLLFQKKWRQKPDKNNLEPQTTIYKWMFGETTIFYINIKIWNHPIETSIYKWLFGIPGIWYCHKFQDSKDLPKSQITNHTLKGRDGSHINWWNNILIRFLERIHIRSSYNCIFIQMLQLQPSLFLRGSNSTNFPAWSQITGEHVVLFDVFLCITLLNVTLIYVDYSVEHISNTLFCWCQEISAKMFQKR